MTGRTHDLTAITALGVIVLFEPLHTMTLSTALVAILANQIGGIAPDIDQPTAPLWRNLPEGKILGKVVDKSMGGHRFLTHSLLGLALFGVLTFYLLRFLHPIMPHVNGGYIWWAFMIGMVSHLIMDTFTKEGVPWLLPIPVKIGLPPIKSLRITTGKFVESFILFPGLAVLDVWFCASHYQTLVAFIHQHLVF
jgi:inner membrane protein